MATGILSNKTMFISGASRGIGLVIAKREAADIALLAKTSAAHPKVPITVYAAAKEIEEAGGHALPIVGDVRDGDSVAAAVAETVAQFEDVPLKRFDLMIPNCDLSVDLWDTPNPAGCQPSSASPAGLVR